MGCTVVGRSPDKEEEIVMVSFPEIAQHWFGHQITSGWCSAWDSEWVSQSTDIKQVFTGEQLNAGLSMGEDEWNGLSFSPSSTSLITTASYINPTISIRISYYAYSHRTTNCRPQLIFIGPLLLSNWRSSFSRTLHLHLEINYIIWMSITALVPRCLFLFRERCLLMAACT